MKTVLEAYRKKCHLLQKAIAKVNNVLRNMIPEQLHIATKWLVKHNEATYAKLYTKKQLKFRKHLNNTMNSSYSAYKTDSVNDLIASKSSTMDIPSNGLQRQKNWFRTSLTTSYPQTMIAILVKPQLVTLLHGQKW